MAKMIKKVGWVKGILAVALLIAVGGMFFVSMESRVHAQEDNNIYQENLELKQILNAFGKGNVDIYASLEDLRDQKPSMTDVKIIRPITVFEKPFFRVKLANGDIVLLSPSEIGVVRASAANF